MAALVVALVARRARVLSASGAWAAVGVGAAATGAGWSWVVLLLLYFVTSVALTRVGAASKAARAGAIVAKGGPRDATQVLANGGVFALASLLWLATAWDGWRALGAGALAAAASDTWGTEVGTLSRRPPRSIVTGRPVPTGTSGGVSAPGFAASVAGAAAIALAALAAGWHRGALAALVGGVVGSTVDSLLGATVQARRWCDACAAPTERQTHACGSRTRLAGGIRWLDNDAVNTAGTVAGGLTGLVLGW